MTVSTQQDYYGRRCGTLFHSYCTGTYTEGTVLLLWGNFAVTMQYSHSYSVVLQGSIGATAKKQHGYFSVGTSAITVLIGYHITGHSNLAVYRAYFASTLQFSQVSIKKQCKVDSYWTQLAVCIALPNAHFCFGGHEWLSNRLIKLIFYASKHDHVTPYLKRLHWLPKNVFCSKYCSLYF